MTVHDFKSQRLYVDAALTAGGVLAANEQQANYLRNVMRMRDGDPILVFNGRDGEWRCRLALAGKRAVDLMVEGQVREQTGGPDIVYLFAPLKRARLDYMVQKAVELGVARLAPVLTRHTIAERVNLERMRSNIIEAAEQCGVLRLPAANEPAKLERALAGLEPERPVVFCDEAAENKNPIATLSILARGTPVALLIGPEGGFSADEREMLVRRSGTVRLSLGPRIMRADTAAVAALAVLNAVIGDWSETNPQGVAPRRLVD